MTIDPDTAALAQSLRVTIGLLVRRLRQAPAAGELTMPESAALARLDRGGPTTAAALARQEEISPQSMGATLAALEARGLVARGPDPQDGRRIVLSVTAAGLKVLGNRRNARTEKLAAALGTAFTRVELKQLAAATPLLARLSEVL